jgi:hypothetical protein
VTVANILIASLGESPVVVPVMYHLLKERGEGPGKGIEIDKVYVLAPQGKNVLLGFDLVEEAFQQECSLEKIDLDFEDANTPLSCLQFLQELAMRLHGQQHEQNNVYLSLAGGRKSMAALIAWIVPFFSCIKGLYHVVDPDNDQFPSVDKIYSRPTDVRKLLMHPTEEERERLKLVKIPFSREQQISEKVLDGLLSLTDEDLDRLPEETSEAIETTQTVFTRTVTNGDKVLEVLITQLALKQFEKFRDTDETHARTIRTQYFKKFSSATKLKSLSHGGAKYGPVTLHFCKSDRTDVRPIIYTQPRDIYSAKIENVEKVIICGFEIEKEGRTPPYRPFAEITLASHFSLEPVSTIDKLLPIHGDTGREHVLLVPLGTHPMIATQLYTLLTQEGIQIEEIVLFYPELNRDIRSGVELLKKVAKDEKRFSGKSVKIRGEVIPGRRDIDSEEACAEYEQKLEDEIVSIRDHTPGKKIILSLSGGRKGMAAMSIFVAQKMGLRYVYHTLIEDEKLSDRIEEETTIEALNNPRITKPERNDRLFLRSYGSEKFAIFEVPVLSEELILRGQ